jgi:hypothetical protein
MRSYRAIIHCGDLNNVGDMALLLRAASRFRTSGRIRSITILPWNRPSGEVRSILAREGIRLVPAKAILRSLMESFGALYVIGGGQMVRPNASMPAMLTLLVRVTLARLTGGLAVAHGLGVTAIEERPLAAVWSAILRGCRYVAVRDARSAANAERSLAVKPEVTADLMFTEFGGGVSSDNLRDRIVVAPCDDAGEGRQFASPAAIAIIRHAMLRLPHARLTFVAHDVRPKMDPQAIGNLAAAMNLSPDTYDVIADVDVDRTRSVYARAALTITNRLHSAIFSVAAQVPVVVIGDDRSKLSELSRVLGIVEVDTARSDDGTVDAAISASLARRYPADVMAQLCGRAERNFELMALALA